MNGYVLSVVDRHKPFGVLTHAPVKVDKCRAGLDDTLQGAQPLRGLSSHPRKCGENPLPDTKKSTTSGTWIASGKRAPPETSRRGERTKQ